MTDTTPPCPECTCEYTYPMDALVICPECAHEWAPAEENRETEATDGSVIVDSVGNPLQDGDTVTVIKTLKVKGSTQPIKAGTKVKGIRLVDGVGDHDIDCRIDGFGSMQLKSSVVRKA
ncbi:zinc ribbon domain-containing protein YjdM [Corynebacterium pygosceleis]|uniref:Zinc ribbon domain-containing protein YjdM n=1 Tax=Corynebacterium pygosceleis TaxID=2800406 RepID=A0A9Q4C847_9CORY|nr:zinc ribbon domain-containing protein YjdM [Corynebacterium pygosceleis]MCK7636625.1 zinc ribbon domain-containing protein YjdM [Corynebacterium pygosceleis]MCK7675199.1 zinc ribbon domain-containing protein YjdM [Corynebacterium pygosceleis]MCL0120586.1 zinc ribbon domain-containing protein YjdM [Corynebacterium pygosceleis]MCX7444137.1 zinc ribbon domain-containing protein YjdM [Corynebacterium pygosceleis]MCX7467378.1 zinc ribbon domain-containing protein YjdM [Corynebacterium pygoscelei